MNTDILSCIGASVLGVAALALVVWAVHGDRSGGRRRCPKCWYDMSGVQGLRCPECGHKATGEQSMFKMRRRWRWAALGALLTIASAAAMAHPLRNLDMWRSLPNGALMLAMSWGCNEPWYETIGRRWPEGFSDAQRQQLARHAGNCLSNSPDARARWFAAAISRDLLEAGITDAARALVIAAEDPDAQIREMAVKNLHIAQLWAVELLVHRLLTDPDGSVRSLAASSLLRHEPELLGLVLDELRWSLDDPEESIRYSVLKVLERMGPEALAAVDSIVHIVERERSPWVRTAAVHALEMIGSRDPAVIKSLIRAAGDEDAALRTAAESALRRTVEEP